MSYRIEVVPAASAGAALVSLWSDHLTGGDGAAARAKVETGYERNPAGAGLALLLHDAPGHTVGALCLHPRRLHDGDRVLRAVNLAGFAVDVAHRTLGPALMLMKRGVQEGTAAFDLVYGLPNARSSAVCQRAGLRRLGHVERFAAVLHGDHHRIERLPLPLRRAAGAVLALRLWLLDWRQGEAWRAREAGFDDPGADAPWAGRHTDLMLSERGGAMLRWRFGGHPEDGWRLHLFEDRAGTVQGHAVWRVRDGQAEVGDFFTRDPARGTTPLFTALARVARREGAHSLSVGFFGLEAVRAGLLRAGLRPRGQEEPVFLDARADARQADVQRWYLTAFDNDAD